MTFFLKRILVVFPAIVLSLSVFAQQPDSTYVLPISKASAFRTWSMGFNACFLMPFSYDFNVPVYQYAYGGYVKKQISSNVGVQADFMAGKLTTSNIGFNQYADFTKVKWSASLSIQFILAKINWNDNNSALMPYLSVGMGKMGYETFLNTSMSPVANTYQPMSNSQSYFIPVAGGFKINAAKGINFDISAVANFVRDDFFGARPGIAKGIFLYPRMGIELALGSRKKQQLATYKPVVTSVRTENLLQGQSLQKELNTQKTIFEKLKTGLNAILSKVKTDSDHDGVVDLFDKCAGTIAGVKVDGSGCPVVLPIVEEKIILIEADKKVVKNAIDKLEFGFNSIIIKSSSFPSLNILAQLLKEKGFDLQINGYSDNVGSSYVNLKFSKDRAQAVKTYLVRRGVDPSKINVEGYGRKQPVATNTTSEGRQQNRRVEFIINNEAN